MYVYCVCHVIHSGWCVFAEYRNAQAQSSEALLLGILKTVFQARSFLFTHLLNLLDGKISSSSSSSSKGTAVSLVEQDGRICLGAQPGVVFRDNQASSNHPPMLVIDLWILYSLASSPNLKSKVLSAVAKKFGNGSLTNDMVEESLRPYGDTLELVFSSLMSLAQAALSCARVGSIAASSRDFGTVLFLHMYEVFQDAMRRQELVACLVSHASSPSAPEAMAALTVLSAISGAETNRQAHNVASSAVRPGARLNQFSSFITSLLEDVKSIPQSQQRVLFRVVFQTVMVVSSESAAAVPDEILILLKKFLSSAHLELKKIAIIGYVAYISQVGWDSIQAH